MAIMMAKKMISIAIFRNITFSFRA